MSVISSVRGVLRNPQREQGLPPPSIIPMADCERLGTVRGRSWVRHRSAEYRLERHAIKDDSPTARLADGATYIADSLETGDLIYWPTSRHALGTFAGGGRRASTANNGKRRPDRRIDALAVMPLLAAKAESWSVLSMRAERDIQPLSLKSREALNDAAVGAPAVVQLLAEPKPIVGHKPAEPAARGAAMLDRLRGVGVTAELTPDRQHVAFKSERGRCPLDLRQQLDEIAPLLVGLLGGEPLRCAWCAADAVTLLAGRAPACELHAIEDLRA